MCLNQINHYYFYDDDNDIQVSCVFIPRRPLMRYLLWYRVERIYPLWAQHWRRWALPLSVLLLAKFASRRRWTKTLLHGRGKAKAPFSSLVSFSTYHVSPTFPLIAIMTMSESEQLENFPALLKSWIYYSYQRHSIHEIWRNHRLY